jgi:hypothetical protein
MTDVMGTFRGTEAVQNTTSSCVYGLGESIGRSLYQLPPSHLFLHCTGELGLCFELACPE